MTEITLNDFNGLVYHYGANGTASIENLNDEQKEIIYMAWARSENIDDEVEADKEINSYYNDFLKAGSKVEKNILVMVITVADVPVKIQRRDALLFQFQEHKAK